ncbi:MAG TPA: hypothetical protein VGC08_10165 [Pedobacter sp.]
MGFIPFFVSLQTPDGGFTAYVRYDLGSDKAFARSLFEQLKGDDAVSETSIFTLFTKHSVANRE